MSDETQEPNEESPSQADEQASAPVRRPGFFSRLFTSKNVENAEEMANRELSGEEEDTSPGEAAEPATDLGPLPEGFNITPGMEADEEDTEQSAGDEPKKKGLFARWFGRAEKEEQPEGAQPEEEAGEEPVEEAKPEAAPALSEAPKKSWFQRLRERLRGGTGNFLAAIRQAIGLSGRLDDDTVEELEDILIAADVGMDTTLKIIDRLKTRAKAENAEGADAIMALFKQVIAELLEGRVRAFTPQNEGDPYVVTIVGVNGVGKTTTIGKMAKRCASAGLKVMLVAGDTFRAAAVEQLEIWAQRTGSEFVRAKHGADPSGLIYDALEQAKRNGVDVVFIDTAGRLQTKSTLMEELKKIVRVCGRVIPDSPHETLLVLDATTGQNAISQTKAFSEAVNVNGLVMTKLDGTAKGGVLLTLRDQFEIPITLVGVGEGVDDLRDFDPQQFAGALFGEE